MKFLIYSVFAFISFSFLTLGQVNVALPNDKSSVEFNFDSYKIKDYQVDPNEEEGYWYATNDEIVMSIVFEKSHKQGDAKVCRDFFVKELQTNSPITMTDNRQYEVNDKAVNEYMIEEYKGKKIDQKNINVYLVHDDYWIDIHISKVLFTSDDEEIINDLVKSIRINESFEYSPLIDMSYGSLYFNSKKYSEAGVFYLKALTRYKDMGNKGLDRDQWRVLIDQTAMSLGISGQLDGSKTILESGIKEDPEYPMFYYNLACVYAESNDKQKCFETLEKAISVKTNMIQGEEFPDPMSDSSFKKYVDDSEFIKIISKIN